MSLHAIIPVKPFAQSKSRLAEVLSAEERAGLSRAFLEHVLSVLSEVPAVTHRVVISRDPAALAVARAFGAHPLMENGAVDLNAALGQATQHAQQHGARALLILPADLPCLSADEIAAFIDDDNVDEPTLRIAPDRYATGTNALFVRPPGWMRYAFGPGSYEHHRAFARRAGARVEVGHFPGLALDVDMPDDLQALYALQSPISNL